jgi:hypothetical protein
MQVVLQATVCDCLALDPFAFEEDGLSAPEVDVSWGKIVEALVIAGMVVMRHEGGDLAFEVAGQVVVLKQDAVLERLMPALNLALGLRVIGRCGRVPFSADPAIARDRSRRTTRRYPTANAVGERRSSCRAQTRIAPDRAWR